jgi:hypothetical protein
MWTGSPFLGKPLCGHVSVLSFRNSLISLQSVEKSLLTCLEDLIYGCILSYEHNFTLQLVQYIILLDSLNDFNIVYGQASPTADSLQLSEQFFRQKAGIQDEDKEKSSSKNVLAYIDWALNNRTI